MAFLPEIAGGPSARLRPQLNGAAVATEPAANRLIVALDFPDRHQALRLIDQLDSTVRYFKIGLELFIAEGSPLVREVQHRGYSIFLDLKLHDIPNTVAAAVRSVSRLGVDMLTVHAAGGAEMLAAAMDAANESSAGPTILAVTVLTSMSAVQLKATGVDENAESQVSRLAQLAGASGVPGLVCSPNEVSGIRNLLGSEPLLVTPGIRPEGAEVGDQKRVATPSAAIAAGASYVVVGRPITRAADPGHAARAILAEMTSSKR